MYCDIFSKISITWQLYIIGQLTQLYTVASYDASVIAPTPGQLRDSLLQWQTDMVKEARPAPGPVIIHF